MSKLGKKRVCKKCRTPFYDLGKENFSCPKCNPNNSANHKGRSKSNPEDAKQISLELDVFEVVHDEPLIGQGVLSGGLELPVSNSPAGWYAVARKNINNQKIIKKDHVLFLGEPPLKGIERYLAGNKFKGVGAVTSGRLVSSHRMQLLHWLCNSPSNIKEKLNITKEQSKSLLEGWNLAPEHNILSVFLNEIDLLETQIQQVERSYGADIIATLNNNPFSLVKTVSRFDFSDAERVCKRLNIHITEEQRILAGTDYYLNDAEQRLRHTCLPENNTHQRVSELLSISVQNVQETLQGNKQAFIYADRKNRVVISTEKSAARDKETCAQITSIIKKHKPLGRGSVFDSKNIDSTDGITLSDEQLTAINNVINAPVSIITGGPGAGKTTMVQGLVSALKALKADVRLCAPTGRAAKRISETPGLAGLRPSTIHMFLGKEQAKKSPSEFNVMIVDEASMIDIDLMLELLRSIPDGASLVLIGDVDQLPPVGSGQPFKDIIESEMVSVSRLTGNFRQASFSDTVKAARGIINGKMPELNASLPNSDFVFIETSAINQADTILELYFNHLPAKLGVAAQDIQILSPQRPGHVGVLRLNELIQKRLTGNTKELFRKKTGNHEVGFFVGDKVIQRKNNYDLKVMNGDQGMITRESGQHLMVEFGGVEIAYDGKQRFELDLAYATTIHSSQGSEYPGVIMPIVGAHSHMLSRNLIYTAVTRGKKQVCIVGEQAALQKALAHYQKDFRWTALTERLKEILR